MTKVYFCGPDTRREEFRGYAKQLAELGQHCCSRWIFREALPRLFAGGDATDLQEADAVVLFGSIYDCTLAWLEIGIAYGLQIAGKGKALFAVGPARKSWLPPGIAAYTWCASFEDFLTKGTKPCSSPAPTAAAPTA